MRKHVTHVLGSIYTKHVFGSETAHKRDRCEKINLYESVKLIGVAGDVDFRRVDCGGGFDLAAVSDVFRAKVDRHIGGGDEHIQHISDHSSDHQRINRSCHQSTERDKEREMERERDREREGILFFKESLFRFAHVRIGMGIVL